tara:strand:+ start:2574 stop:3014 length:441 start_codon:yes stop_codon:yes gene_type:complete
MSQLQEDKESVKDNRRSPTSQEYSRLTDIEVQSRVDKCFDLRYNAEKPILQREWVAYCKKTYGDKSVPQYTNYWMSAKNDYEEIWKSKLEGLLEPAMQELVRLLDSPSDTIKQRAIDQIIKYTGNDIQKHLIHAQVENITIGFGND